MKRKHVLTNMLLFWMLISVGNVCFPRWSEAEAPVMRAIILFDDSGSMRKTDPHQLSKKAAQLFLTLARPDDSVGLVAFSDTSVPLVPLLPLSTPQLKEQFHAQLRHLTFRGQTTDLRAALEAGLASLPVQSEKTSRDVVLLLTDGKLDLGRSRRADEPAALAYIRQTLLPQYRQRNIALYTIAFTAEADQALLQEMARVTQGEFRVVQNAAMLHQAFSELFVLANQIESLPIQEGTFLVDQSIQEASLVLSKQDPLEQISLVTPQEVRLNAQSAPPNINWTSTPSYDHVQLKNPEAGPWRIDHPSRTGQDIAIINSSPLTLQIEVHPVYREVGEPLTIQAFLEENKQRINDPSRLEGLQLYAEITSPQGEVLSLPFTHREERVFTAQVNSVNTPGQYRVKLTATSSTFHRQRALTFSVHPPCFQTSFSRTAPLTFQTTLSDTCPAFQELTLEAEYSINDTAPQRLPLIAPQPKHFQVTIPPLEPEQTGKVVLHIRGQLPDGETFDLKKGPWDLPKTAPLSPALSAETSPPIEEIVEIGKTVGFNLLLLNGILVILGGVGWYGYSFYRTGRKKVFHK